MGGIKGQSPITRENEITNPPGLTMLVPFAREPESLEPGFEIGLYQVGDGCGVNDAHLQAPEAEAVLILAFLDDARLDIWETLGKKVIGHRQGFTTCR